MFHGLLVSSGFSSLKILDKVHNVVFANNYKTCDVVTTANPKKENSRWAVHTKEQLESIGLNVNFVDFDNGEKLNGEVVYVCGGNTFHLLKSVRENNIDFSSVCFYIGSSAGSVLVGESILPSYVGGDKNKCGLKDFHGLGYVQKYIFPHYISTMDTKIEKFLNENNIDLNLILKIADNEGYYFHDGKCLYIQ